MSYATQANVERALGGAAVLAQLLDPTGMGTPDAATVSEVLDRADAEVNSAIQIAIQLPLATVPNAVVFAATDVAAYLAWTYGSRGQAVPDDIRLRYEAALRWLDDIASRKRTLGSAVKPTSDLQAKQVERSTSDKPAVTFNTLRGFCW